MLMLAAVMLDRHDLCIQRYELPIVRTEFQVRTRVQALATEPAKDLTSTPALSAASSFRSSLFRCVSLPLPWSSPKAGWPANPAHPSDNNLGYSWAAFLLSMIAFLLSVIRECTNRYMVAAGPPSCQTDPFLLPCQPSSCIVTARRSEHEVQQLSPLRNSWRRLSASVQSGRQHEKRRLQR